MAGRPLSGVPNNFAGEGTGTLNNVPLLDANFTNLVSFNNDSAIGYVNYANDTGVANSYVLSLASPPSAYIIGMTVVFRPSNTNTGPSVINVNSLGSVSIVNPAGIALNGGEISQNSNVAMVFNGTSFAIMGPCSTSYIFSPAVGNQVVECAGYSSVSVAVGWATATSTSVTLNHVCIGMVASVTFVNGTGAGVPFSIEATNPAGSSLPTLQTVRGQTVSGGSTFSGGVTSNLSVANVLSAGQTAIFTGVVSTGNIYFS
jgi:hypothetical protein